MEIPSSVRNILNLNSLSAHSWFPTERRVEPPQDTPMRALWADVCVGYGETVYDGRGWPTVHHLRALRDVSRVGGYVGVALTLMLLIAAASYRQGRPELARSIEYYASH